MTDDLFRKEALQHRSRSLYGNIILRSPPGLWIIVIILAALSAGLVGFLFFGRITTDSGVISLLDWLLEKRQP